MATTRSCGSRTLALSCALHRRRHCGAARTTLAETTTISPYDAVAPSASRLSSQFSTAVQATTTAAPSTPAIPIQDPRRDHVHPSANAATITASQPLFGTLRSVERHGLVGSPGQEDADDDRRDRDPGGNRVASRWRSTGDTAPRHESDANTHVSRRPGAEGLAVLGLLLAVFVLVYRVLGVTQRSTWPPPPTASRPVGARAATEAFAAREGMRPHDAASTSPGRRPRASSRASRARASSRGSSPTSRRGRPCTS